MLQLTKILLNFIYLHLDRAIEFQEILIIHMVWLKSSGFYYIYIMRYYKVSE